MRTEIAFAAVFAACIAGAIHAMLLTPDRQLAAIMACLAVVAGAALVCAVTAVCRR